ncbi:LysR family transcriptional regulator [Pseudomonas sp.]|uniref:LysR family transcriptional regulator n=1 Tax=Pseudomonas sp. TaxID=306 RepID=UPI003D0C0CD8
MNRNDLRRADINLLVVFETLMRERNLTRVGEKLFLGQPTISAALGRLRSLFNDPLFIRVGRAMEPTARAEEIHARLTPALDAIAAALASSQTFDPQTSDTAFRIGLSDDVEYAMLPRFMQRLRDEAPNITLVVRRADQWQLPQLLVAGEISLGISHTEDLPANSRRMNLRPIRPMLLHAGAAAEPLDLDAFCQRPHVVVSSMGNVTDETDRALNRLGRQRKVVLAVPQFSCLPTLLANSDLVALVPDYVALAMAQREGLNADRAPLDLPVPDLSMAWHGASHNDPRERWLRSRFSAYFRQWQERPDSRAVA